MALAACWLPLLLYADFQGHHTFKLVVWATAAAGLALAIIQPPFPFQVQSDLSHNDGTMASNALTDGLKIEFDRFSILGHS